MNALQSVRRWLLPRPGDRTEIRALIREIEQQAAKIQSNALELDDLFEAQAEVRMEAIR